jgi:hypothetical protein
MQQGFTSGLFQLQATDQVHSHLCKQVQQQKLAAVKEVCHEHAAQDKRKEDQPSVKSPTILMLQYKVNSC